MKKGRVVLAVALASAMMSLLVGGSANARRRTSCGATNAIVLSNPTGPVTPGGISRLADDEYYVTYSRIGASGREGSFGLVTPDIICGPMGAEETIKSTSTGDYSGPYPGLEPGSEAFLIVFTGPSSTLVEERSPGGTYDDTTTFQAGLTAGTLQRIGSSLTRLAISIDPDTDSIYTQTVKTQDPATWGPLLLTKFGVSAGSTGSDVRATAAWTGNGSKKKEIVMAWQYIRGGTGDRNIRYAINSNYQGSTGWSSAHTLVSVPGEDLSEPFVFRWKGEVRVYFLERNGSGGSSLAYMSSSDHAQTWTGPFDVLLPTPGGETLADLTAPTLAKSVDGQFPVVVVGARAADLGTHWLVAFEQGA